MDFNTHYSRLWLENKKMQEKVLERIRLKGPLMPDATHPDLHAEEKCWSCGLFLTPVMFRCPKLKVATVSMLVIDVCGKCKAGKPHFGYICKICSLSYTAEEVWKRRVTIFMGGTKPKKKRVSIVQR